MFSQTRGTALGNCTADTAGLGYSGAAIVFGAMLAAIVAAYYRTNISRTALFWAAFILTRPLGAVVGDVLDKPLSDGGLELGRYSASVTLLVLIGCVSLSFLMNRQDNNIEYRMILGHPEEAITPAKARMTKMGFLRTLPDQRRHCQPKRQTG
jgi:uncharacterized membrane-anchored protein